MASFFRWRHHWGYVDSVVLTGTITGQSHQFPKLSVLHLSHCYWPPKITNHSLTLHYWHNEQELKQVQDSPSWARLLQLNLPYPKFFPTLVIPRTEITQAPSRTSPHANLLPLRLRGRTAGRSPVAPCGKKAIGTLWSARGPKPGLTWRRKDMSDLCFHICGYRKSRLWPQSHQMPQSIGSRRAVMQIRCRRYNVWSTCWTPTTRYLLPTLVPGI